MGVIEAGTKNNGVKFLSNEWVSSFEISEAERCSLFSVFRTLRIK